MSQYVASIIVTGKDEANEIATALQDLIEPAPDALTLFEHNPTGQEGAAQPAAPFGQGSHGRYAPQPIAVSFAREHDDWKIEAYYSEDGLPAAEALRASLAEVLGRPVPDVAIAPVPDNNWVAMSQAALPPVQAGRFVIHGSHDRDRVPRGPNAILIDAGEAFGTAHHATTSGCLQAIDRVTRTRRYRNVLDLGCGSGVLAIAVARVLPRALILASDMDVPSVAVAAANMALNGVGARIHVFPAAGLDHPFIRHAGLFDLLIANILAGPLIELAPRMSRAVEPGGTLLLSGILVPQAPQVIAAYRASGFILNRHDRIYGWSTLQLSRAF